MELLLYVLFSSMEYISGFVFILIQFRFPLLVHLPKMILIAVLLSFVSYSFMQAGIDGIFPLVYILIFVAYLQMTMKIGTINALIMAITVYVVYGLVQTCVVAVFSSLGFARPDEIKQPLTAAAYQIQTSSCLLMLVISYLTYYFKGGFSFIEERSRFTKRVFKGKNKIFFIYVVLAFVIAALSNAVIFSLESPPYLIIAAVLLITLNVLFYLTMRRDETNA